MSKRKILDKSEGTKSKPGKLTNLNKNPIPFQDPSPGSVRGLDNRELSKIYESCKSVELYLSVTGQTLPYSVAANFHEAVDRLEQLSKR